MATTPHFGLPDSGDMPTVIAGWREPAANPLVGRHCDQCAQQSGACGDTCGRIMALDIGKCSVVPAGIEPATFRV